MSRSDVRQRLLQFMLVTHPEDDGVLSSCVKVTVDYTEDLYTSNTNH
jgi:hypothetical protein